MTAAEELDIINRVQQGEVEAFESRVKRYQKNVYNLALRMLHNEEDALDMTQESFLRAYNSINSFRGESKFSVWLYRLTSNICIDFLRSEKRRSTSSSISYINDDDEQTEIEIPDIRWSPEQELEKNELQKSILRGLESLPDEYRQILVLREINGLSYDEIGAILSLESGTVKSRLFRARKRLCSFLVKDGNIPTVFASDKSEGGDLQ